MPPPTRLLVPVVAAVVTACSPMSPVLPTATPTDVPTPAATAGTPTPGEQPEPTTLRLALDADPTAIQPGLSTDAGGDLVVDALFDSLTAITDDGRLVPSAARAWELLDEGLRWRFTLRPGGRFHDGTTVNAGDFARSFQRIADGTRAQPSLMARDLSSIEGFEGAQERGALLTGVRIVDDLTLDLVLSRPDHDLPRRLAAAGFGPVPQSADLTPATYAERPIGNGPFAMAEDWQHNQFIRVRRAPVHPDVPGVDEIILFIYAGQDDTAFADLENGRLDAAVLSPEGLSQARTALPSSPDGRSGPGVVDGPSTAIYHFGFDTRVPPFDDPRVRRAVSLVIDRVALRDDLTRGSRDVATSIVPEGVPGARPDVCDHCRVDVEAARALLDEVREVDPETGDVTQIPTILLRHDQGTTNAAIAAEIADDLRRELDLDVEVVALPLAEHVQSLATDAGGMVRLGWRGTMSLASFLDPMFRSTSSDNLLGYANDQVDELLDEAAAAPDDATRTARLQEVEDVVLADVAVAPVHVFLHRWVVDDGVAGWLLRADGSIDLTAVRVERAS